MSRNPFPHAPGHVVLAVAIASALAMPPALAQAAVVADGDGTSDLTKQLDAVEVTGIRGRIEQAGRLGDAIEKTEVIDREAIERTQSGSLAQAIETAPGVRVQNECSMCGIKRVMINGSKGEQTTILLDGVPMHSVVSSYYGIDAVTSAGIAAIEVARGAGAALATPEAIGGAINIVSERGFRNGGRVDVSAGDQGYARASAVLTGLSASGRAEGVLALQYDNIDRSDADRNGVTEAPDLTNRSITARGSVELTDNDLLEARVAAYRSDVFGGPANANRADVLESIASGNESAAVDLFEGGDVRRRFTGLPYETAELIDTSREEVMLRYTRVLNDFGDNVMFTASRVSHGQNSNYEGFDYVNDDDVTWLEAKANVGLGDAHVLGVGLNHARERMRSESQTLAELQAIDPTVFGDSFDYRMVGAFIRDDWGIAEGVDLSLAARWDRIEVDYVEQPGGSEVSRSLVSPRALLKIDHGGGWASRASAGRGYRAPLSFFESDHGLIENGYDVAITDLEVSLSLGYTLSYEDDGNALAFSVNHTGVENLAFIDFDSGPRPVLRNATAEVGVLNADVEFSHEWTDELTIGGGIEHYRYDTAYRQTFSIAPIEERVRLFADWHPGAWEIYAQAVWVGSRNLSDYGVGPRFNVIDAAGNLSAPKGTVAGAYTTVDLRAERALGETWSVYVGGSNLTDVEQAMDEESPLFFDEGGGYDVVHIYGPLRGRVVYAGIKASF